MISKSLEEYLKTIYIISKKEKPRVTDIATKMGLTKASVNKALKQLKEEKMISYEPYGNIEITEIGINAAKRSLEANDIVYLFLKEILEEDEEIAQDEAKDIKKAMRASTLNKLAKYIHKELGLYSLDCGYDIESIRCIDCIRRVKSRKEE